MTEVYLDSVFLLNALMDYLLLLGTACLAGIPPRRWRYALSAVGGGLYAAAVFLPGMEFLSASPVKLTAGVLLAVAAFGGEERLLRLTLLLFAVSCALAGCVLGLGLVTGGMPSVNGIFYTDVDAGTLLVAATAAYLVLTVIFRAAARHGVRGELLRAEVCLRGKTVRLTALRDTGTSLSDPVSGQPVLVVSRGVLDPLLPPPVRRLLTERGLCLPADLLEPLRRTAPDLRFYLLPYRAGCCWRCGRSGLRWAAGGIRACRWLCRPRSWEQNITPSGADRWEGEVGMSGMWQQVRRLLTRLGLLEQGDVHYIGGSDTLPPPLTKEREAELLARLGEEPARQELIEHNLRLVVYIARRFENTGVGIEALISIGTIGLIKAVGTYRTDKNIKLATYASRCIENEILMFLRKNANRKGEVSFDEPLNTDWDGNELLLSDVLGTEEDTVMRPIEEDVDRSLLAAAINVLSPREKQIISLRFGLGGGREQTQKEVADRLGISQSYISRLEKRIISRLKKEILRLS